MKKIVLLIVLLKLKKYHHHDKKIFTFKENKNIYSLEQKGANEAQGWRKNKKIMK